MQADILRKQFLDFFKARKHKVVESASLVPADDPTVLFTPAGMNQFKEQFLGSITDFRRAASSQRCLRTDDLDKVGHTSGHHTLFEMLGNFSFGDYFKKEAIEYAWEFLTKVLKISQDKLWVSVYQDDDEAYKIWKDVIGLPEKKIVKLGDKDNFWPSEAKTKGPNGPCGPCSEIFYDFGGGCGEPICDPSCSCGRFVEIWNLVFTQFNRKEGGILEPLPQKNIDTGMGLERLVAVMEGAKNNFETDLFQPLIKEIKSGAQGTGHRAQDVYAVADHIRAITFSIYDGILPSNEGRGYVVRKVIRKSVMHLRQMGITKPFLYKLVAVVAEIMKVPYPDLVSRREDISQIVLAEENNYTSILKASDKLMREMFETPYNLGDPNNVANLIFRLTDEKGLPVEIIVEWLDKHGRIPVGTLDLYNKKLEEQRVRSRLQSSMKGDVFAKADLKLDLKPTSFLGYKNISTKAKVLEILGASGKVKKAVPSQEVKIILDKTAFYPNGGGQVGDSGILVKGKNIFEVSDTQKIGKIILHIGKVKQGSFKKTDLVLAQVDAAQRMDTARNHTATHLLQAALRKVLGTHVQQQGSLVEAGRLRFDFTHFKGLTSEEISRVEELVNDYILADYPLSGKEMLLAQAKKTGALALFSEKYEGKVRVIAIGEVSKEFCGGTHLKSTGVIGLFKIAHEGSVASGVRRIEALTGKQAYNFTKEKEAQYEKKLEAENLRRKEIEKKLGQQKVNLGKDKVGEALAKIEKINEINLIADQWEDESDIGAMRGAIDAIKQKQEKCIIAFSAVNNGRVTLVMGSTSDLLARGVDVSSLIKEPAALLGGSGGGRKDFAQAGGNQPENLAQAFAKIKESVANLK